jgi:iron(II)-dependent oxidoreductase
MVGHLHRDTPLCPAGHLPHKGGDRLERCPATKVPVELAATTIVKEDMARVPQFDLPPCGGDARQGRGGLARHDINREAPCR